MVSPSERLSSASLPRARVTELPTYERSGPASIVQLGLGAFSKAHLCTYADELLRQGYPAMVHGVSISGNGGGATDRLNEQDGLYSLTVREPGRDDVTRVVGSVGGASIGAESAIAAIAAPTTTLVTVTVTEKGYVVDPDDLSDPSTARSAPAVLAHGLARVHADGRATAPVIASLDNLRGNGDFLRERVLEVATAIDPALARWIGDRVAFPTSVVDRMTPATTPADLDAIEAALGLRDEAAVTAEAHRSWILTRVDGLPPFADVGVLLVDDTVPFQHRKLWLLNGPHSAAAYAGLLRGHRTIAEASTDPVIATFLRAYVDDVLAVADLPPSADAPGFAEETLHRFENPRLGHACLQVATDGSTKLPERLFPVVAARERAGLDTERAAVVVALWLTAVAGVPIGGNVLPTPNDPRGDVLRAAGLRGFEALVETGVGQHAGNGFKRSVHESLLRIVDHGTGVLADAGR